MANASKGSLLSTLVRMWTNNLRADNMGNRLHYSWIDHV